MSHVAVMSSMCLCLTILVIQMWLPFGAVFVSVACTNSVQLSTLGLFRAKPFREPVSNPIHAHIRQFNNSQVYLLSVPSSGTRDFQSAILLAHP
jgi:hypothetical protein